MVRLAPESGFIGRFFDNLLITIAWDIDDVLNDFMRSWFERKWLVENKECGLSYEDLVENPPNRLLGVGVDEYLRSLDEFRLSSLFGDMLPSEEAMRWFLRNGPAFRHIALTAVPLVAAPVSAGWVMRHFGPWIRTFHFVPSKRAGQEIPAYDGNKADFLRWVGKVDVLIDDSPENIREAEKAGVKGFLISRPWNHGEFSLGEALKYIG